jgi:hypothetical protein
MNQIINIIWTNKNDLIAVLLATAGISINVFD